MYASGDGDLKLLVQTIHSQTTSSIIRSENAQVSILDSPSKGAYEELTMVFGLPHAQGWIARFVDN